MLIPAFVQASSYSISAELSTEPCAVQSQHDDAQCGGFVSILWYDIPQTLVTGQTLRADIWKYLHVITLEGEPKMENDDL